MQMTVSASRPAATRWPSATRDCNWPPLSSARLICRSAGPHKAAWVLTARIAESAPSARTCSWAPKPEGCSRCQQISPAYDRNQRRAHLWPEQGVSGGRSRAGQGKCAAGPEHTRPDVQHLGYKKRDLHANTLVKDNVESTLHELWPRQPRKCPATLSHLKLIPVRIP